ncbi:hypothetical protein [Pedobacter nototheniae]|uniref:hypothetical protein n=1 Tax=Pedobacter nototheniae TaxID=2488994 RepID=UPI00292ED646|nr:hypothetical protein [Pedobacter nototheniae]
MTTETPKVGTIKVISDTLKKKNDKIARKIVSDSLILYNDFLYSDLKLNFTEISKNEFQSYKQRYKTGCVLDSGNFIRGSDLYVSRHCNEICETYLSERTTNRKMLIPSSYDAGILTMLLSPACNKLIVCSSYDGPDYRNYYKHRAEIFVFKVTTGIGLKGIKPALKFYTKNWSIEDLTWVDDKIIALKIYEEAKLGDGSGIHYKYYKADL